MRKRYTLINQCNHNFQSNNFYVYQLETPDHIPFYVGKGRDNRAWRHISLRRSIALNRTNPHLFNTINKLLDQDNQDVIVRLVATYSTEAEAFTHETKLVEQYGRRCDNSGILTNINRGGEGNTKDGRPVSQYTLTGVLIATYPSAKEAARIVGLPHYSTICGCCKGRERSYGGYLCSYEGEQPKLRTKIRAVVQINRATSETISVFNSIREAAQSLGCDPSTIRACLIGDRPHALGFNWQYYSAQC